MLLPVDDFWVGINFCCNVRSLHFRMNIFHLPWNIVVFFDGFFFCDEKQEKYNSYELKLFIESIFFPRKKSTVSTIIFPFNVWHSCPSFVFFSNAKLYNLWVYYALHFFVTVYRHICHLVKNNCNRGTNR